MASRVAPASTGLGNGSELREVLIEKARQLFALCDTEQKGFITKRCMQRLHGEIPLDPEQLEQVFNSLDGDENGYLTLEEFTDGFGMFMGIDTRPRKMSCTQEELLEVFGETRLKSRNRSIDDIDEEDDNEDDENEANTKFEEFLESLGAHQLFKDEDYVRLMWNHLHKENPSMLTNFEELLTKVTGNIKKSESECSTLENALMSRKLQQERQVQKLYEEMETQLKVEKERALVDERKRQDKLRTELATELHNKDRILQELLSKHCELEDRYQNINDSDTDIKLRNAKLEKERDILEKRLKETERIVEKMQNYMENLRQQSLDEKRARAESALQATEAISLERENMIKQLEVLRTMNKELLDQRDEINTLLRQKKEAPPVDERPSDYHTEESSPLSYHSNHSSLSSRRGSRLSDYFSSGLQKPPNGTFNPHESQPNSIDEKDYLIIDEGRDSRSSGRGSMGGSPIGCRYVSEHPLNFVNERGEVDEKILWASNGTPLTGALVSDEGGEVHSNTVSPGPQAVGGKSSRTLVQPERLFKVVIVGDSSVGKSSLLNRFCQGHFVSAFHATIGVDFRVKSVNVEGRAVALQLWDTAGQERFRSITKQYFRKADGVIIVYDVTSEQSFKNIRDWVTALQEAVTNDVALMIVGNKSDMDTALRMVSFSVGQKLAHEYEAIFHETSAKTGQGIEVSMEHLASLLRVKEDEEIEKAFNLTAEQSTTSKRCC